MVRLRRTARLEAEFITSILHPPIYGEEPPPSLHERPVIDPGLPAPIESEGVETLVRTFQRYESADENKLYRAMNQVEQIRRIRQGEQVPAPAALDVSVHSDSPRANSTGAIPFESAHRGHKACTEGASANDTSEQHPPDLSESNRETEEPD